MRKKVATAKKKVTLTRWDPVENLTSEEAIAAYLDADQEGHQEADDSDGQPRDGKIRTGNP
jgi:hypothetical protein